MVERARNCAGNSLGLIHAPLALLGAARAGTAQFPLPFFVYLSESDTGRSKPRFRPFSGWIQSTGTGQAYLTFMHVQAGIAALLLAFAGSMLIGSDSQHGGMIFYLSRSMDRRHYIIGKILSIATVVSLITTVPALILYIEYGVLSSSFDYFIQNWRIVSGNCGFWPRSRNGPKPAVVRRRGLGAWHGSLGDDVARDLCLVDGTGPMLAVRWPGNGGGSCWPCGRDASHGALGVWQPAGESHSDGNRNGSCCSAFVPPALP